MRIREFHSELWLPLPPAELFEFFGDAGNLDALTPPWLHFHILTPPPIEMKAGALINYRLRVHGLPLRWRTRIKAWQFDFANKEKFDLLDQRKLTNGETWAHLAAAGDELFVRELNALVAYRWSVTTAAAAAR